MLSLSNYVLQYSQVNFGQVLAAKPDVFITEAAPVGGTPQLTNAQVLQLTQNGTQVFGYVDSCATDDGRPYWNRAWTSDGTDKGTPTASAPAWLKTGVTNPFGITTDFRDPAWRQIVIDQCVDLVRRGYSGIFLDDVAQYFNVGLALGNTDAWARAMLDLVTDVKDAIVTVNPNAKLIINSTPYITSDALGSPTSAALITEFNSKVDAMMLEVFYGISFAPEEAGIQQAITAVKPYMTVLALEYGGTPFQNQLFKNQAESAGFVPGFSIDETYSSFGSLVQDATSGADALLGTRRADVIDGLSGDDRLLGNDGNDTIQGNAGNDTIDGGQGNDALNGGTGDDNVFYDTSDNADFVLGGAGTDTLIFVGMVAPTTFSLAAHEFEKAEGRYLDTGTNSWASYTDHFNSSWQLDFSIYLNDNGTTLMVDFDQGASNPWQSIYNNYDTLGRLSSVYFVNDNGTRNFYDFDETGTASWTYINYGYDVAGRLSSADYVFDNGTRSFIDYDETATSNWSYINSSYDAAGRLSYTDYNYDNGTRNFVDYDESNAANWSSINYGYDAAGRLSYTNNTFDNGTRIFVDYDEASQYNWARIVSEYNAQGVLINTTVVPDLL